jgi:hypothetical protein
MRPACAYSGNAAGPLFHCFFICEPTSAALARRFPIVGRQHSNGPRAWASAYNSPSLLLLLAGTHHKLCDFNVRGDVGIVHGHTATWHRQSCASRRHAPPYLVRAYRSESRRFPSLKTLFLRRPSKAKPAFSSTRADARLFAKTSAEIRWSG